MSGKDDGIGGLILLGAVVLVGAALFGGGGRKKEEEASVVEDTPEEELEQSVRCYINNSKCNEDVVPCPFCERPVCSYHSSVSCHCGGVWGCCDCWSRVPEYCGSCI